MDAAGQALHDELDQPPLVLEFALAHSRFQSRLRRSTTPRAHGRADLLDLVAPRHVNRDAAAVDPCPLGFAVTSCPTGVPPANGGRPNRVPTRALARIPVAADGVERGVSKPGSSSRGEHGRQHRILERLGDMPPGRHSQP